jgi:hypothetical protein
MDFWKISGFHHACFERGRKMAQLSGVCTDMLYFPFVRQNL